MKKSLMVIVYWITLFAVTLSGADVCRAANYDIEPDNDKRIYAKEVTFGDKIVGNLWHALDYDWYAVNVPYAGTVSLTAYYEFPSGSTADTDVLFVEVRNVENDVITDFFIDYMDYKTNTPYIRDINIPSSGNYYIVVHCPNQAKFKRDRYYITMSRGGGENATVSIVNEENISLTADEQSTATIKALVKDEDGNPVVGAPVVFSRVFGDTINDQGTDFVFSSKDISSTGISNKDFFLFYGEKEMTFTYVNDEQYVYNEGGTLVTATYPSYFKAQLINATTGDKTFLFSTTEDKVTEKKVSKTVNSDGNYYLEIEAEHGIWEVVIPNKTLSTISNTIGTTVTGSDGIAHYIYKSTDQKGNFTLTASFGNSSDKLVFKQTAGSPTKVNILELVEDSDNDLLYINREYTLNVIVTDKNGNLVEDDTEINLASSPSGLTIKNSTAKTKSGMAKFTISSATAKEYTLTATVKGKTSIKDTLSVKFNTITLSNMMAQPAYVLADGQAISTISVRLSNSNGLAVSGEPVSFSTTSGTLLTNTVKTDEKGIAQVSLVAPSTPGTCTVTASYGTAKLTTQVIFYQDGTGTTSSIELTSSSNTVAANGTSSVVLTAKLLDSTGENVVAGTPVKFTTDKGIFPNGRQDFEGNMPPTGEVKVALISQLGQVGKANITCSSGGISQSIQITFTPVNSDGSPAGENTAYITLKAEPASIPADGKSSLMISATLKKSTGESVPAGTEIIFYAANGKFANGLLEFTAATTDNAGKVYVGLISSTTPGPVDVWCLSNGVYQLTTVTFLGGNSGVGTINLKAEPANVPANGASSTSITAELKDTSGNPVPAGTSVVFTAAPAGIGKFSNNTATITVKTPDDTGKVIIPFISAGTTGGLVLVSAASGGASQSTLVTFEGATQPNTTASIALTTSPNKIPADGKSSLTITATLYDSAGKPMPKGTSATFSVPTGRGTFANGTTSYPVATADDSGKVSASLISSTVSGNVDITCKSNNLTQLTTVYFTGSDSGIGSTSSITLTVSPANIPADGASSSTITITLKDATGIPVIQGTSVTLSTTLGTLSKTTVSTVDDKGIVSVSLKAGTEAGNARVVCSSNGVTQAATVVFTGGTSETKVPAYLSLALSQLSVKTDNSDSTTVKAIVLDSDYAVIKGVPVSFTAKSYDRNGVELSGGQLGASLVETDENGLAEVIFSSGTIDKSNRIVTISAKISNLPVQTIPVQVIGSTLEIISEKTVVMDDKSTEQDDSTTLLVTITALDAAGKPVYDTPIKLESVPLSKLPDKTVTGEVSWTPQGSEYKTDFNGKVTVTVSGKTAGNAKLNVTGLGVTEPVEYNVVGELAQSFGFVLPATDLMNVVTRNATDLAILNSKTISFKDNGKNADGVTKSDTIERSDDDGSFISDKFKQYDQIMVGGSANNDGVYIVQAVTEKVLTLTTNAALKNEGTGKDITITNSALLKVRVPKSSLTKVRFATTIGNLNNKEQQVLDADVIDGFAFAVIHSPEAGVAKVSVSDYNNPPIDQASISIVFSRPIVDAASVVIKSNTAIVAPNTGGSQYTTAKLTAFVKSTVGTGSQPVAGVPVIFTIENSTGSGETLSPVVAYTNGAGEAYTTFTSGTLSSDAKGVIIQARVVGSATTGPIHDLTFTKDQAYNIITRTEGDFTAVNSQFKANQNILVSGSIFNDGYYDVIDVSEKELTLDQNHVLTKEPQPKTLDLITFKAPDTIERGIGSFIDDGFISNQYIKIEEPGSNSGLYVISNILQNSMKLTPVAGSDQITDSNNGQTITIYQSPPIVITALAHSTKIVVGGTSGSVVIGRGNDLDITDVNMAVNSLPMSVLVSDLNGNPVAGAQVSLNLWPEFYRTGVDLPGFSNTYISGIFPNEDTNENTTLDPGEDTNKDGRLTPENSAAGNIPTLVTTDANGVASFNLVYLKTDAYWIQSKIKATTMVFGTETTSVMSFILPTQYGFEPFDSPYILTLKTLSGDKTPEYKLPTYSTNDFYPKLDNATIKPVVAGETLGQKIYQYDDSDDKSPVGTVYNDFITYGDNLFTFPINIVIDSGTDYVKTYSIDLESNKASIKADGTSTAEITATIKSEIGVPLVGKVVRFSVDDGSFIPTNVVNTDKDGIATVKLTSSNTPGLKTVTVASDDVSKIIKIYFSGDPETITLSSEKISLTADSVSTSKITALIKDKDGYPVPDGETITFAITTGAGTGTLSAPPATTTSGGYTSITYTAPNVVPTGGKATVSATSNNSKTGTVDIELTVVDIGRIILSVENPTIPADGQSSTSIKAEIKDTAGQPVDLGTLVVFTTNLGKFANGQNTITVKTPDNTGSVIIPLIADTSSGRATIKATVGNVSQSITVSFEGGENTTADIMMTASPDTIPANGVSTLTVTAALYDSSKKPVKIGTEAIFYASSGTFDGGSGSYITALTKDTSGKVSVALRSSTAAGKSDITCYSNGITELITVYFTGINTEPGSVASITLSALPISIPADGKSSSTITITLKDNKGEPVVKGTSITLSTNLGTLSKTNISTVDDTGVISVSLIAGTTAGTARVVCSALSGVTQTTTVVFTGGTSATPTQLGLALSQIAVKTDNSDSTTITATVLDENAAVIPDVPVSFTADGGQLSAAIVKTDANGQAKVQFSSGSIDKSNRVVNVTATVSPLDPKTIPVQITGSTISLSNTATSLILDDPATIPDNEANSSELTITAKDAGGKPVYNAPIQITHTGSIAWTTTALTATINGIVCYTTNINGQIILSVTGTGTGSGTIDMKWYDTTITQFTTATQTYTVAAPTESFGIRVPDADLTEEDTGIAVADGVTVTVYAPTQTTVRFATTMGGIGTLAAHSDLQVKDVLVNPDKTVTVVVRSDLAGVATIEVSDKDNPATVDRVTVAFVRPDNDAATIKLQSNTAVIAPSVGANKSIAEFTAYVKTSGDTGSQAVAGVPVVFSIDNSTGSGESVSPVIVYTNEAGEAKTTFTAGSLGSDAEGVTVNARVVGSAATGSSAISFTAATRTIAGAGLFGDFKADQQIKVSGSNLNDGYYTVKTANAGSLILSDGDSLNDEPIGAEVTITALTHSTNIVIGGTAGSVVIGRGAANSIVILNPSTYALSMSVLVSDLNGNPVSGADVSLSLWPERYNTGVWYDLNDKTTDHYVPYITGSFINEDYKNQNTSLDPGEDENKDGILTPPNSAAGNIPTLLTTNEDGYAVFDIIYLKSSAVWIDARITATTMVFGTETKSTMTFTLPAEKVEAEAGYLPDSPYPYVLKCPSGGTASFRLPAFAGISNDTFSPWIGKAVGVAGTEVYKDNDPTEPVLYYTSYDYEYDDTAIVSPVGTTLYDWIAVSDLFCGTSFPIKIVIE